MSLTQMYPAKNNSPRTYLTADISTDDASMTVANVNVLPPAPNLVVLGTGDDAEIIKYTAVSENILTGLIRGVNGTIAKAWEENTIVARNWTAQDAEAFRENILDLEDRKANTVDLGALAKKDSVDWGEITGTLNNQNDLKNALDAKQNTLPAYDTTPTAGSTNIVTSGGVKTALDAKTNLSNGVLYFQNQATSATSSSAVFCTISDTTRITTKHVVTEVYFSIPSAVTTNVTWNTNTAGQVTLSGVNNNANNKVTVTLALAGNL